LLDSAGEIARLSGKQKTKQQFTVYAEWIAHALPCYLSGGMGLCALCRIVAAALRYGAATVFEP